MESKEKVFYIFCFAICTPQTKYINNRKVNDKLIEIDFYNKNISQSELEKIVKPVRFYRNKARYLIGAKEKFWMVLSTIGSNRPTKEKRSFLVNNFKGVGMKVASEFMRDIGYRDLAIIDVHILRYMKRNPPKNQKEYLQLEKEFCEIAKGKGMTAGDLDAEIWKTMSGNKDS